MNEARLLFRPFRLHILQLSFQLLLGKETSTLQGMYFLSSAKIPAKACEEHTGPYKADAPSHNSCDQPIYQRDQYQHQQQIKA